MNTLDKQLKRLNADGKKQYGKKWIDFDLTQSELDMIGKIKEGDQEAVNGVMEDIYDRIADQMPATIGEKFDAWRKMAMLLNPVTHIRNVDGNILMAGLERTASRLSGLMQKAVPKNKRTRAAVVGKEYKKIADEVFQTNAKELLEQSSRFDGLRINMPNRRIFNSILPQRLGKIGDNTLTQTLKIAGKDIYNPISIENIRKFSYTALEKGDTPFFKNAYTDSLASFMQARGIANVNGIPQEGFDYALKSAQQATFKDPSQLATWIAKSKQIPVVGRAVDTVLPFPKTSIAIAKRGIEYSPLGLAQSLYKATTGKGAAEAIDALAKGLTGSGLFGLGILLYDHGIITAGSSTSKNKREFEKTAGISPYSIMGKWSYDWAQPFAIPIAAGAATARAFSESGGNTDELIKRLIDSKNADEFVNNLGILAEDIPVTAAVKAGGDVLLDQPLLQSASNFISRTGEGGVMEGVLGIPRQYVEQMIPTGLARVAGYTDPTIRATQDTSGLSSMINTAQSKIPNLSDKLPEKRNVWGDAQTRIQDPTLRFAQQFLSPANLNVQNASELDKHISSLYDTTRSTAVFPTYQNKPFTFDSGGEKQEVGYRELPRYQQIYGNVAKNTANGLLKNPAYQKASPEDQVNFLSDAYDFATYSARLDAAGGNYKVPAALKPAEKAYKALGKGIKPEAYISLMNTADTNGNGSVSQDELIPALSDSGLSTAQKAYMFMRENPKSKNNPYEKIQSAGILESAFDVYYRALADIESSKYPNGKTISGSLKMNRRKSLIAAGATPSEANKYLNAMLYDKDE